MGNTLAYERFATLWGHAVADFAGRNRLHRDHSFGLYTRWLDFCANADLHPVTDINHFPGNGERLVRQNFGTMHEQAQELDMRQSGTIAQQVLGYIVVRTSAKLRPDIYDQLAWSAAKDDWAKHDPQRCVFVRDLCDRLKKMRDGEYDPEIPIEHLQDVYRKAVRKFFDEILSEVVDDEEYCEAMVSRAAADPAVIRELRLLLRSENVGVNEEKVARLEQLGALYGEVGKYITSVVQQDVEEEKTETEVESYTMKEAVISAARYHDYKT